MADPLVEPEQAGGLPLSRMFAPLRVSSGFRNLWLSSIFFFSGFWAQTVVLAWLAFELTGSEFAVAAFTAARFAPLLLGPLGGVIADRVDRPRLLLASQLAALAIGVGVAALTSLGAIAYWQVLFVGFLVGMMQSPLQPTRFTLIMDLVGRQNLSSANALTVAALMGSGVVAPAIAGALIAAAGADVALWFSATWYVPAALMMLGVREVGRASAIGRVHLVSDLADGFRSALRSRELRGVLVASIAANLFAWPAVMGFLPVFAEDILDVGPRGFGLLVAANGVGGLVGAVAIAGLGDFRWKFRLFLLSTGCFGLFLVAFALTDRMALALVLMLAAGAAGAGFGVMQSTLVLLLAPEEVRGRVLGVLMLSIGVLPVAMLVQGAIAAAVGVVPTTLGAGLLLAASMVALAALIPGTLRLR